MDENEEQGPSTSKLDRDKGSHKSNSNTDVEKQDEPGSSVTSLSNTHSETSRLEMGQQRSKAPTGGKKERRPLERKKKRRPPGRVVKRPRRVEAKRPVGRRSKRIKDGKKKRDLSVSTILTRLSSGMSVVRGCPHCGHGCCRRRFNRMKKGRMLRLRNLGWRDKLTLKNVATQASDPGSECIQVGSRCLMLSPLCITTNASPQEPVKTEEAKACEISPEMIHEALRRLTMWRHEVDTSAILDYIKRRYPVGFSEGLLRELAEKLRIATIVGIAAQTKSGFWCLGCALQNRKLTPNHVTLFWEVYADSLKPVVKKPNPPRSDREQDQESSTQQEHEKDILPKIAFTTMYM